MTSAEQVDDGNDDVVTHSDDVERWLIASVGVVWCDMTAELDTATGGDLWLSSHEKTGGVTSLVTDT